MVGADAHSNPRKNSQSERRSRLARFIDRNSSMKAKVFEVMLHKLPSGRSPASALEEQLNDFLGNHPELQVVATHMNTVVAPAEPNAMPSSEESSIIIFCTVFYTG